MKFKSITLNFIILLCLIGCLGNCNNICDSTILASDEVKIEQVAVGFYNWYIHYEGIDNNDPKIDLVTDSSSGGFMLGNIDKYFNMLDSLKILSPRFLKEERQRFADCNCFLKTYNRATFENTYDFDNTPCGFFTYMYWFRSQEGADKVKIASISKNKSNDTVTIKLNLYVIDNADGYKQYHTAHEVLIKMNDTWLIDAITVD